MRRITEKEEMRTDHVLVLLSIRQDHALDINIRVAAGKGSGDLFEVERSNRSVRHHQNLLPMNMPAIN